MNIFTAIAVTAITTTITVTIIPNTAFWGFWRVCCESKELPKGCECFDISSKSDFTNSVYQLPTCPDKLGVKFLFYDRGHNQTAQGISAGQKNILKTSFSGKRETVIICHGFTDEGTAPWMIATKDALLETGDFNVILVDWKFGAAGPKYFQAVANTRMVGALIARLIWDLHVYTAADFKVGAKE
ncbi:pancreatic lipase-related protein 2 [Plakobranchus ocellatus]|uniref:Pancreatic lipase-related protein 2 n=1 Tax=Plakobranchus ocellatus TaxID=259542 RepID=A0AAV4DBN6_9GAST|nr:pancreatic lipase-related protein 2 [Plakobranchus ocellatus]